MLAGVDLRAPIPEPDADGTADLTPTPVDPARPVSWRVDRRLTVAKWAGAGVFALASAFGYPDPGQLIVCGLAALLAAVLALRDVLAPVRLSADGTGLTVLTGFAGRRSLPWNAVERIRVDARRGVVLRSQVLEIDTGDNLYFFSINDLGVPPADAATYLTALRTGR